MLSILNVFRSVQSTCHISSTRNNAHNVLNIASSVIMTALAEIWSACNATQGTINMENSVWLSVQAL